MDQLPVPPAFQLPPMPVATVRLALMIALKVVRDDGRTDANGDN